MLTMLFLLFCLNGVASLVNSEETIDSTDKLIAYNREQIYNKYLINKIEEKVSEAYHHWDSIPVLSPIKIRNIKYMSSDYGYRRHPILHKTLMHCGLDFSAKPGTTVYSTAKGVVTKVKRSWHGYGNEIIITHGSGYSTRYAHLGDIYVEEGQRINTNTYIGTVGNTGMSTGPHLHYEILHNKRSIDPMFFTYDSHKNRSISKYFETLIALEGQQEVDKNLTLGMYHKFSIKEQVLSSS